MSESLTLPGPLAAMEPCRPPPEPAGFRSAPYVRVGPRALDALVRHRGEDTAVDRSEERPVEEADDAAGPHRTDRDEAAASDAVTEPGLARDPAAIAQHELTRRGSRNGPPVDR